MEKIRWFVYEIDPNAHRGVLERLKPCGEAETAKRALSSVYNEPTEAYEGHDLISGQPFYLLKSWNALFVVSVSRMKVKGELRAFECWA
jgi:hypothetical protein